MLSVILKTLKGKDDAKIVGQTTKTKMSEHADIARKVTGENATGFLKTDNTTVIETEKPVIDIVPKSVLTVGGIETTGGIIED